MSDRDGLDEEAADALRARESLENDPGLGGVEFVQPTFTGGERLGELSDVEQNDDEEALDDEGIELTGDDE
jgi:hypothetical protein